MQAAVPCIEGINQIVLVLQPDESMQYMLFSEERALRDAAAKQAALEAKELGLVSTYKSCEERGKALCMHVDSLTSRESSG